jgi:hypothetical protein
VFRRGLRAIYDIELKRSKRISTTLNAFVVTTEASALPQ